MTDEKTPDSAASALSAGLAATVPGYELYAKGESLNGWAFRMRSREIYTDKRLAESAIPDFTDKCCDESQLECAARGTLKVQIAERLIVTANVKVSGCPPHETNKER